MLLPADVRCWLVQAATQQVWSFLEERLSAGSTSAHSGGGGASTESSRSNRYVAQLEARQVQLTTQLSAARQEQGEAATRLAAAQTSIATLQAAVQRLAAAGGGTAGMLADMALLGPASPEPSGGLWATAGACARQQQQPSDGGAASQHSGVDSGASWRQEKRLLKSICKLALAVTMDHVAGVGKLLVSLPLFACACGKVARHQLWYMRRYMRRRTACLRMCAHQHGRNTLHPASCRCCPLFSPAFVLPVLWQKI